MNVKSIYKFLKGITKNNNREWFNDNKPLYLEAKENADQLAMLLLSLVGEVEPDATKLRLSDITYRIYRDTRFSIDKTPYKTHIGIFINPPKGKKSLRYGYYFHLEPGKSIVCGGNMPAPTPITTAIRKEIFNNIDEYLEIIKDPDFQQYFPEVGGDCLKMAPKGFPKDWEYIDLLKPREFGVVMNVEDEFYEDIENLPDKLRPIIRQMKRLNDFINYTIDDFE